MIPYKMKHKATGLYYKPGRPNLSKIGKAYGTGNNGLNYMGNNKFVNIISTKAPLSRRLESLGYKLRWVEFGTHCCFEIPKSEFEIEYLTRQRKQYTRREFIKMVESNGFYYDRCNGSHSIYINSEGRHISIPKNIKDVIIRRLIKENNLDTNLKKKKK